MITNYYSTAEFLEIHCDAHELDPVGRKVYKDEYGVEITVIDTNTVKFCYDEGYSITVKDPYLYSGYDEVRNMDTLFVLNHFERTGKDLILARFKHEDYKTEG